MHVLIIEDEPTQRLMLQMVCESLGFETTLAGNGEEGLLYVTQGSIDFSLVLTDLSMPMVGGREVIRQVKAHYPHIPVIVITSNESEGIAEELKGLGAQDFLNKPVSKERLDVSIRNALQLAELRKEVSELKRKEAGDLHFNDLIGAQQGLAKTVETAQKFAKSDLPVLITGESGVGKEMLARAIHGESTRSGKPFIAINCGAIPANLVESTLFGHEKGAFTGAIDAALGKFREAQGGTLLLDEVGELPLDSQVKLLRALQQSEVEPVGLGKSVSVDVRVIAATNVDLPELVGNKQFREDLFFRLNVLPLSIPPLRERSDDIPLFCSFFIQRLAAQSDRTLKTLSDNAISWAQSHAWKGNVRELENTLSRAVLLSEGDVIELNELKALAHPIASSKPQASGGSHEHFHADGRPKTLEDITLDVVAARLELYQNDVQKTADSLGMPSSTLYRKLRDWRRAGLLAG